MLLLLPPFRRCCCFLMLEEFSLDVVDSMFADASRPYITLCLISCMYVCLFAALVSGVVLALARLPPMIELDCSLCVPDVYLVPNVSI